MTIFFAILALLGMGFAIFVLLKNKKLEDEILRVQSEAQAIRRRDATRVAGVRRGSSKAH